MPKNAERPLAPHVQAAIGKAAQPKTLGPALERRLAPHVQAAIGSAQPKTAVQVGGDGSTAAHVRAAIAAVGAHVKLASMGTSAAAVQYPGRKTGVEPMAQATSRIETGRPSIHVLSRGSLDSRRLRQPGNVPVTDPSGSSDSCPRDAPIQPMKGAYRGAKAAILGNKVPSGVVEKKKLGGGYGVGYNASKHRVVLYDFDGALAHVEIQLPSTADDTIILHTRGDRGETGGQGYMTAMFPIALKIIQERYSRYAGISMTPAPGAATKGMISLISRLRRAATPDNPGGLFGSTRVNLADRFLQISDRAKYNRKKLERTGKRKKPTNPQDFDATSMLETAWELNALRELESADPLGMTIHGATDRFNEKLVGAGSPLLEGGALAWHESAKGSQQAIILMSLPMAALPRLIAALPD